MQVYHWEARRYHNYNFHCLRPISKTSKAAICYLYNNVWTEEPAVKFVLFAVTHR